MDKLKNKTQTGRVVDASKVKKIVAGTLIATTLMTSTSGVFADSKYEGLNYRGEGYISVAEEVGPNGNGGFISTGEGDAGGISYGLLQLTSKAGGASANKFAFEYLKNNHPEYYKFFEGVSKAGTQSFSDAWTKAYNHNPGEFEKIQLDYKDITYVKPAVDLVKKNHGIDLLSSRARTEWVHATSVQFGPGGVNEVVGKAGVSDKMNDEEFIAKLNQEKRDSVGTYKFLGCSQSVRNSVHNRFTREEKEMVKIAKEEAGDSLEDVLNADTKEKEVVSAIEAEDVDVDVEVDTSTDKSDEDESVDLDKMEDETIIDESEDGDSDEGDNTTGGGDEPEDETIVDEDGADNADDSLENVDEDNSVVDEDNAQEPSDDVENSDEDNSIVDEDNSDNEDLEDTEDESIVDDESDNSDNTNETDEDNSIVDETNDNETTEDETMEDESIVDTDTEESTDTETDTEESTDTNETIEDESVIDTEIENNDSNTNDSDASDDNANADNSDDADETPSLDDVQIEVEEIEDGDNTDEVKETPSTDDSKEAQDNTNESDDTQDEVQKESQEEVQDDTDKADDTQEETQNEVKEDTQNDSNQVDVQNETSETEQVVAMSDSEARIQELQTKLEGNFFHKMIKNATA